jgi:predicted esterase
MYTEHHIRTTRTARYFTLGEHTDSTEYIWIVLHGYAQLAKDFIRPFEVLDNGKNFIIAPEALNRFYAKGFSGQPAATWMTSEDRLNEISDYVHYLDQLYEELGLHASRAKVILLGFSQGVATASRWLHATHAIINHFIIYAGEVGKELLTPLSAKLRSTPILYVTGKKDPMITREEHLLVYRLMQELQAELMEFDGGHEILPKTIQEIYNRVISAGNTHISR